MQLQYIFNGISEISSEMWIFITPIIILQFIMMVSALISIIKKEVLFKEKIIWILVTIVIAIVGPIVYFAIGSRMIDEKISRERDDIQ